MGADLSAGFGRPERADSGGSRRGLLHRRNPRFLVLLWVQSWAGFGLLWPDAPPGVRAASWSGVVAFAILVVWWALHGFAGYEHLAGLRIIDRGGERRGRTGARAALLGSPLLWGTIAALGLGALLLGAKSVAVVATVAIAAFLALLTALTRRFSVFGTISIVGVVLGVAALIVVQSVATGFQHEFERRVLGVYAHINVTRQFGIAEYRRFGEYLRTVPGVTGVSPFVYYAMAVAPKVEGTTVDEPPVTASALVKGIDPETAAGVIDIEEHLERGSGAPVPLTALRTDVELQPVPDRDDERLPEVIAAVPDPRGPTAYADAMARWRELPAARRRAPRRTGLLADDADESGWPAWPEDDPPLADEAGTTEGEPALPTLFMGATLARRLGVGPGDVVTLVDPGSTFNHREPPQYRDYVVAGLFRAGFQEYDSGLVYVHIRELQWFKYQGRDVVSGLDLRLRDPNLGLEVEGLLDATIGDGEYSILEWEKLNANLFESIRTQRSIITIILSLVITVASFNVLAALWTMVVRRTPEIAILMSMGATEDEVARIFQFTGMTIGFAGSLAGVAFGLVLSWLVELYGYGLDPEVYFIERLPVEVSVDQIVGVLVMTLGICFVATIPPSLRAARLRPVEGLRYE
jgi:lipoprotein-releasing system permease protein